ncbi:hypothetical protein [Vibrio natriegens]|uniref:hypothetical protein n=1 Tax=Vibrio natriegens TaxID=691 RepID=UPI0012DB1205|nr:hypothetical protein [Vibrio natriegens]
MRIFFSIATLLNEPADKIMQEVQQNTVEQKIYRLLRAMVCLLIYCVTDPTFIITSRYFMQQWPTSA